MKNLFTNYLNMKTRIYKKKSAYRIFKNPGTFLLQAIIILSLAISGMQLQAQNIMHVGQLTGKKQIPGFVANEQTRPVNTQREKQNELLKNGKSFHCLTFHFKDFTNLEEMGEVIVVNEDLFYDREIFFTADRASYGTENGMPFIRFDTVAEGSYHVMVNNAGDIFCKSFNEDTIPRFVFFEININRDIDTIINIKETATHKISMNVKDENGQKIDNAASDNLFQYSTIDIQFPEGMAMKAFAQPVFPKYSMLTGSNFYGGTSNCFLVSDIGSDISFLCTQAYLKHGKLYMTSFVPQTGCSADIALTNQPGDFQAVEWTFDQRTAPASNEKYLTVHFSSTCYRPDLYYSYVNGTKFGFCFLDSRYPLSDGESLCCYLDNRQWKNDKTSAEITYWEGPPSHNGSNSNYIESPGFFTLNDSVVLTNSAIALNFDYKVKSENVSKPVQLNLGQESLVMKASTLNNYFAPDGIYLSFACSDQLSSALSSYELARTNFSLTFNDQILLSGSVPEFPAIYNYNDLGVYTLALSNTDYIVNDINGEVKNILTFDVSEEKANPPRIDRFYIKDENGMISLNNTLKKNTAASLVLNAYDYSLNFENVPVLTNNIEVYYKSYYEDTWAALTVEDRPDLSDTLFNNYPYAPYCVPYYCYSSDLSPAIETAGYIDLKIVLKDEFGNSNTNILHPAFFVYDGVGLNEPEPVLSSVDIYPNPVTNTLTLNYAVDEPYRTIIINTAGDIVYTASVTGNKTQSINLKSLNLANGIYFIQLISDSKTITKKIIYKN